MSELRMTHENDLGTDPMAIIRSIRERSERLANEARESSERERRGYAELLRQVNELQKQIGAPSDAASN
jgi:hypothetical protein